MKGCLNQSQHEELALIEQAYNIPHKCKLPSFIWQWAWSIYSFRFVMCQVSALDPACIQGGWNWVFWHLWQTPSLLWHWASGEGHWCGQFYLYFDLYFPHSWLDYGPQSNRLHHRKKKHCPNLWGHASHQHIWPDPWSAIFCIHLSVLWSHTGPSCPWSPVR